jgi:hypothetical protein
MGRPNNRPGYSINKGSLNPYIHIGSTAPAEPQHKDLWLNTSTSPGVLKWYDSASATWK